MAGISETITITDGVTPILRRMAGAADEVAGRFNAANTAGRKMSGAASSAASAVRQLDSAANDIDSRGMDSFRKSAERTTGVMGQLRNSINSSIGQFAIGNLAASGIMYIASAMGNLANKTVAASDRYAEM